MCSAPTHLRWLPLAAVVWLVLALVIVTPTADLLAFGVHEHVTASDDSGRDVSSPGSPGASAHHCELSISPAGLGPAVALPASGPIVGLIVDTVVNAAQRTPSVPLGPPRG